MVLSKLCIYMQRYETGLLYFTQKSNKKWIKDLHIRPKTVKFLEENRKKLLDIGFSNNFLNTIPILQATKAKIDKWEYIKTTRKGSL